jgi:hypothetical protein
VARQSACYSARSEAQYQSVQARQEWLDEDGPAWPDRFRMFDFELENSNSSWALRYNRYPERMQHPHVTVMALNEGDVARRPSREALSYFDIRIHLDFNINVEIVPLISPYSPLGPIVILFMELADPGTSEIVSYDISSLE